MIIYDDLFLCRMMMRMYTLVHRETEGQVVTERCAELWDTYHRIEPEIFEDFRKEGVRPVPINVVSDFNGVIKNQLQLVFCCANPSLPVPRDIYALFEEYGVKDFRAPEEPPVIRFGYTGRSYDYKTKTRLVTDGLQIGSLDKIVLDVFSLENMTKDGVTCRLTHELLHVFGVSEEDMATCKPAAFLALRDRLEHFSEEVLKASATAKKNLCKTSKEVADHYRIWREKMENLGNRLTLVGFPATPQTTLTAKLQLPEGVTSKNTVTWQEHEVLFM